MHLKKSASLLLDGSKSILLYPASAHKRSWPLLTKTFSLSLSLRALLFTHFVGTQIPAAWNNPSPSRIYYCHNPTQLNPKLGRPYFPKKPQPKPQNRNHKTEKPSVTFSQLLHNQTQPISVCNLISIQLEDSCQKKWVDPLPEPPKKN